MAMLFHVGCGAAFIEESDIRGNSFAKSCSCGAYSPILVKNLNRASFDDSDPLPASLITILARQQHVLPHIEIYIGTSDFECAAKTAWVERLKSYGLSSMNDCQEARCVEYREREVKRRELGAVDG